MAVILPGDRLTDAAQCRRLMSRWATGVSVITSQGAAGPRGCTVNSLTSLSLDPLLLIVCLDLRSNTLEAVRESGRFCINILAAGQERLSRRFAVKDPRDECVKFGEVEYEVVDGAPALAGCLAWIVCDVDQELPGGDHAILVARPLSGRTGSASKPLIFYRSAYWDAKETPAT